MLEPPSDYQELIFFVVSFLIYTAISFFILLQIQRAYKASINLKE